jgi:hypothetical protein
MPPFGTKRIARFAKNFADVLLAQFTVTVSKNGYHTIARSVAIASGETKYETFTLVPESGPNTTTPTAFNINSPSGKHLVSGMPGNVSFSTMMAWNGSAGSVRFNVAGTWYTAGLTDLGNGIARAAVTISSPSLISTCSELLVEVINGEAQRRYVKGGIHFHPVPGIILPWYGDNIPWTPSGLSFTYTDERSRTLWRNDNVFGLFGGNLSVGYRRNLSFDPLAGTFQGSIAGVGNWK